MDLSPTNDILYLFTALVNPVSTPRNPLWLALRFPCLSLEAQGQNRRAPYTDAGNISNVDDIANIESSTEVYKRDKHCEEQALKLLEACCYHFSPYIERQQNSNEPGILMELSRCLKLFKGLEALCATLFNELDILGYHYAYGIAHTAAGAWLLSWQAHPVSNDDSRTAFLKRLQNCPIGFLQCEQKTLDALDKTGFQTLGDIYKQIRHSSVGALRKRFGNDVSLYLQDIFAIESQKLQHSLFQPALQTYQPEQYFCEHLQLDYPLENVQLLRPLMETLLQKFEIFLQRHQLQSSSLCWRLYDIYQNREQLLVNTCQLNKQQGKSSWQLFLELSLIQFESKQLPFAVDTLELYCNKLESLQAQTGLLAFSGKSQHNKEDLQISIARIKARLGNDAIYKVSYCPHHVPEKSCERITLEQQSNTVLAAEQSLAQRPGWLLAQAQKIQERENTLYWRGKIQLMEGPERIEGYWWETFCARDYYIGQREDNLRLWLYQDLQSTAWYVHGVFA